MRKSVVILLAAFLLSSGCVAQKEPAPVTPSPLPTESADKGREPTIYTDWSKLGNRQKPLPTVGSRWYDDYTEELILRDDYGPLIPYAGLRLRSDRPTYCLYGLMTKGGVVVTDAVYSSITSPWYSVGASVKQKTHPLLALCKGDQSDKGGIKGRAYWAIAASDGSWCTDFCYIRIYAGTNGLILFEDDRIAHMSPAGVLLSIWTMAELGFTQGDIDSIYLNYEQEVGRFGEWCGNYFCLGYANDTYEELFLVNLPAGQKEVMPYTAWKDYVQDSIDTSQSSDELSIFSPEVGEYIESHFLWDCFSDTDVPTLVSASQFWEDGDNRLYFLVDGTPLPEFTRKKGLSYYSVSPVGGLIEELDLNIASYYDIKTMDCVFRTYLGYDTD